MQYWQPGRCQLTEFDIKLGALPLRDKLLVDEYVSSAVYEVDRAVMIMLLHEESGNDKTESQHTDQGGDDRIDEV